jgi:hypothetical protein
MSKEDEPAVKISKRVAKTCKLTDRVIEMKDLSVSGKDMKEVKKVFDEEWRKE